MIARTTARPRLHHCSGCDTGTERGPFARGVIRIVVDSTQELLDIHTKGAGHHPLGLRSPLTSYRLPV